MWIQRIGHTEYKHNETMLWLYTFLIAFLPNAIALDLTDVVQMETSVAEFSSNYWIKDEYVVSDNDMISATFVIKHNPSDVVRFEKEVLSRSTPQSPKYRSWLTRDQISHLLTPPPLSVSTVVSYLKSFGISDSNIKVSRYGHLIRVKIPAKVAENMLGTTFARFRSESQRDVTIFRITSAYYLPRSIADVVSLVDDILRFPAVAAPLLSYGAESADAMTMSNDQHSFSTCGSECFGYLTPAVIRKMYHLPSAPMESHGGSVALAEFQQEYNSPEPLEKYWRACGVGLTSTTANYGEPTVSFVGKEGKVECDVRIAFMSSYLF